MSSKKIIIIYRQSFKSLSLAGEVVALALHAKKESVLSKAK
jgi:hypothetical protein